MSRKRKYKLNDGYFEKIDTPEKAYILGFIYADGSINGNYLSIVICESDIEVLNFIQKEFETDYPIRTNRIGYVNLTVCSNKMVNDLISMGILRNKTYTSQHLPYDNQNKYYNSMICGFFDGDGSIYASKRSDCNSREYGCCFSGNFWVLNELKKYLQEKNITSCNIRHRRENNYSCMLEIKGRLNIVKLKNLLYDNVSFSLMRKKNKFIEFDEFNLTLKKKIYRETGIEEKVMRLFNQGVNLKNISIKLNIPYPSVRSIKRRMIKKVGI